VRLPQQPIHITVVQTPTEKKAEDSDSAAGSDITARYKEADDEYKDEETPEDDELQVTEMDEDIETQVEQPQIESSSDIETPAETPAQPDSSEAVGIDPDDSIQLLQRIEELYDSLPEDAKTFYDENDLLLRMETLKRKLQGAKGVLAQYAENAGDSDARVTGASVADAFSYIRGLAGGLPDPRIGLALTSKITHIVETIRREPHG
jgi:hypothetical protein